MSVFSPYVRRALLLASSFAATALGGPPSRGASFARPVQDLGPIDGSATISATLWLRLHDETGFEAAVADRMDPASADYHRWMTRSEVAALSAGTGEVRTLVASLKAAGLTVTARGETGDALRVTGSADAIGRALGTTLHGYAVGGTRYRAPSSEPHVTVAGGGLVAGITGLDTASMVPYVLAQTSVATGKPLQFPLATAANPASVFTTQCFRATGTYTLAHFVPNGGTEHASLTGPQYVSTGVAPAANTCGYTAAAVSTHYGLPAVYRTGDEGQGQTIVLVDAYGSPTIMSDANAFSTMMGLPALTASTLKIVYPDGPPIANPYPTGWPVEISLDVEWAHAIAPKAKLVLVVAPSDDAEELSYALNYAVSHQLGEVISNSYGYPESGFGPATARAFNNVIAKAAAEGIAVDVSTGDSGDFGLGTPLGAASIPADSPFATGVGGTSLDVPSDSGPVESSWGTTETFIGDINGIGVPPSPGSFTQGGGGGESAYLEKPRWQAGLTGAGRKLPDISAVADPFTGGIIVTPNGDGTQSVVEVIGGTSLSSPVFSGIWALANQAAGGRLGQAAPIIARMPAAAVTDIKPVQASRSNLSGTIGAGTSSTFYTPAGLLSLTQTQPNGFVGTAVQITSPSVGIGALLDVSFGADSSLMALPGWDDATGYGVPNGLAFVRAAALAK